MRRTPPSSIPRNDQHTLSSPAASPALQPLASRPVFRSVKFIGMNIITICVIIKIAFCPNKIGLPPGKKAPTVLMPYEQLVRTFKQVDYARYMASRPQTLYGIADSPVGLAAWLLDHNDAEGQRRGRGAPGCSSGAPPERSRGQR